MPSTKILMFHVFVDSDDLTHLLIMTNDQKVYGFVLKMEFKYIDEDTHTTENVKKLLFVIDNEPLNDSGENDNDNNLVLWKFQCYHCQDNQPLFRDLFINQSFCDEKCQKQSYYENYKRIESMLI